MPATIGRRELIAGLGGAFAWPIAVRAQQPKTQQPATKKRVALVIASGNLGHVNLGADPSWDAFFAELKSLGYVEGENLIVERYSAEGRFERYDALAREVAGTQPDVIVTYGTPLTTKFKAATSTIPIVTMTGDPIRFGLVKSIAHPGGNITGVSVDAGVEVWGKRLELLTEAVPKLNNVLYVSTQGGWDGPGGQMVREAAQKLGISLVKATVNSPFDEAEYRRLFSSVRRDQVDGVMISSETEHVPHRFLMVQLIQQMRLPATYPLPDQVEAGGLMSYSYDLKSAFRRQATQVAEVLHGANPSDIPYFQETRFELVINLKAAKELGLEIPSGLVAGAAAVIE
jgi:putative tryptophan/tyrosine transport system substrate-binding protein